MGYETRYSLDIEADVILKEVKGIDSNGKPASVFIRSFVDVEELKREIADQISDNYLWSDGCKWYDHQKDMRSFSRKYPEVLFILSGEGEESGDMWRAYFKNGKMQFVKAKIVFDDFNAALLS
jgi:hypothetical protein